MPPLVSSQILRFWRLTPSVQITWRQVELFQAWKDFLDIDVLTILCSFPLPLQFLKVASTKVSNSREKIVKWHSRDMVASVSPVLGLTKCSDSDAAGWVPESLNRGLQKICWKANPKHKYETPFCVYKRGARLAM